MVGSCRQSGSSLGIKRITCWVQPGVLGTWVGGHFPVFFSALVGLPGFGEVLCTPSLLGCSQHSGCQHLPQLSALWEAGLDSSIHTGNGHEALCPYPLKSLHCYKECSFNGLSMLHYYNDEDGDKDDDDDGNGSLSEKAAERPGARTPGHCAFLHFQGSIKRRPNPSKPCSLLSKVAATQHEALSPDR